MQVVKCAKGHYYDASKYSRCPHCERIGYLMQTQYKKEPLNNFLDSSNNLLKIKEFKKKRNIAVAIRLLNWLFYSFIFSALPIILNQTINMIFDLKAKNSNVPDLFVLVLVISSTTMKDILDDDFLMKNKIMFLIIFFITFTIVLISSVLYGAVIYNSLSSIELADSIERELHNFTMVCTIISVSVGVLVQVYGEVNNGK